jgi:tetratricopeptide (TPR) repeat protein
MATFYPQLQSPESLLDQWYRYLKQKPLINNIDDIINEQTKQYNKIISNSTDRQVEVINNSIQTVCGTIEAGFEMLSYDLKEISYGINDISSEINKVSSILDWKLSTIIENLKLTNLLLGNIAILLRIPDIQKERQDYIEKGLKFFKNASFDDSLYENSLKYLLKAEEIEPEDFFTLHRIGLIYLYSSNHLSPGKAEKYFRDSAKFAVVELNSESIITKNYVQGDPSQKLLNQLLSPENIRIQAAESYLFAGRCCFLQENFNECSILAEKAFELVPDFIDARYLNAQALVLNNKVQESISVLEEIVDRDIHFTLKIAKDPLLIEELEIQIFLKKTKESLHSKAIQLITKCKESKINHSVINIELTKVENLLENDTIIHNHKALSLLELEKEREFAPLENMTNQRFFETLIKLRETLQTSDNKYPFEEFCNPLFEKLSELTQWDFPIIITEVSRSFSGDFQYKTASGLSEETSDYDFIKYVKPKKVFSTLNHFVSKETKYSKNIERYNDVEIEVVISQILNRSQEFQDYHEKQENKEYWSDFRQSVWDNIQGSAYILGPLGLIIGGLNGCYSCISNTVDGNGELFSDYNLFTGSFYGAAMGLVVAIIIGTLIAIFKKL